MSKTYIGTGRRKSSVAQVKMTAGKGKITVNGVDVNEFMPYATYVMDLKQPLVVTDNEKTYYDYEYSYNVDGQEYVHEIKNTEQKLGESIVIYIDPANPGTVIEDFRKNGKAIALFFVSAICYLIGFGIIKNR